VKGGITMPVRKSQQKAVNRYVKNNYDRVSLVLKQKGYLDEIKAHATSQEESVNAFITRAIFETMERDTQRLKKTKNPEKNKSKSDICKAAEEISDYVYGVFEILNKNFDLIAHNIMIEKFEEATKRQAIVFDIEKYKSENAFYDKKAASYISNLYYLFAQIVSQFNDIMLDLDPDRGKLDQYYEYKRSHNMYDEDNPEEDDDEEDGDVYLAVVLNILQELIEENSKSWGYFHEY